MSHVRVRKVGDAAFAGDDRILRVGQAEVALLKETAPGTKLGRARILAHGSTGEVLHEMVIAHTSGSYVPPHKHPGKSESGLVLEGEIVLVFFEEDGTILDAVELGDYRSGRDFYYRVDEPIYHTLLLESEVAVVQEVTNGPFDPADTVFADWAPAEGDLEGRAAFQRKLTADVSKRR